jgi:hypothetical protein
MRDGVYATPIDRLLMDRTYSTYVRSDISPSSSSTQQGSLIWIVLLLITSTPEQQLAGMTKD